MIKRSSLLAVFSLLLVVSSVSEATSDSTQDSLTKIRAERAVKELLKDGRSAEFRNVEVMRTDSDVRYTCGEVNSRNSFGGYAGFQRFISVGPATFLQEQVDDFEQVWRQFCN